MNIELICYIICFSLAFIVVVICGTYKPSKTTKELFKHLDELYEKDKYEKSKDVSNN
jgi:hypothetical protein